MMTNQGKKRSSRSGYCRGKPDPPTSGKDLAQGPIFAGWYLAEVDVGATTIQNDSPQPLRMIGASDAIPATSHRIRHKNYTVCTQTRGRLGGISAAFSRLLEADKSMPSPRRRA